MDVKRAYSKQKKSLQVLMIVHYDLEAFCDGRAIKFEKFIFKELIEARSFFIKELAKELAVL